METEHVQRNVAAQRELYGEPLADIFRRLMATFGFTQGQLAQTLGLSAPMLSQLITGQRVKITSPAVLQRIEALTALGPQARAGHVDPAELTARLEQVRGVTGHLSGGLGGGEAPAPTGLAELSAPNGPQPGGTTASAPIPDAEVAAVLRGLLRAVASGQGLRDAVEVLRPTQPALAEVLEVYGLGSPAAAADHLARNRDLF